MPVTATAASADSSRDRGRKGWQRGSNKKGQQSEARRSGEEGAYADRSSDALLRVAGGSREGREGEGSTKAMLQGGRPSQGGMGSNATGVQQLRLAAVGGGGQGGAPAGALPAGWWLGGVA